jgi:hypothetical protein
LEKGLSLGKYLAGHLPHSNAELAQRLGCSLATVGCKLDRIRHAWQRLQNEKE